MTYWTAFMLVTTFVARMGDRSLAVQSYTLQVQRMAMIFSFSIGLGTEIIIGHLVGAGLLEEAYHRLLASLRTGLMLATGVMLVLAVAGPLILGQFTHDAAIVSGGALLLWLSVALEPGRVFNVVVISSLRATGDVGFPIQMAVLSMWLVWVPLAWFLGLRLGWGLPGVWIAMTTDEWLRGLLMQRRWRSRRWYAHARRSRAHIEDISPSIGIG